MANSVVKSGEVSHMSIVKSFSMQEETVIILSLDLSEI